MWGMGWYFNGMNTFGTSGNGKWASAGNGSNYMTIFTSGSVTFGAQKFFPNDKIGGTSSLKMSWMNGDSTSGHPITSGTSTMFTTVYYYTEN